MQIILSYNICSYSGQNSVSFLYQITFVNFPSSWINVQTYFSVSHLPGNSLFGLRSPPRFPKYRCAVEHRGAQQSAQQRDMRRHGWHRSHRVAALNPQHPRRTRALQPLRPPACGRASRSASLPLRNSTQPASTRSQPWSFGSAPLYAGLGRSQCQFFRRILNVMPITLITVSTV